MRKLRLLGCVLGIVGMAGIASAADYSKARIPRPQLLPFSTVSYQAPPPAPGGAPPAEAPSVGAPKLFHCVKVKDPDHIHPCAVPKMVKIVDPCWKPCKPKCGCCQTTCCPPPPPCVYVKICVPPCGCERVKCSKNGRRVKYDYGKYSVEVESRNGQVVVDYDD